MKPHRHIPAPNQRAFDVPICCEILLVRKKLVVLPSLETTSFILNAKASSLFLNQSEQILYWTIVTEPSPGYKFSNFKAGPDSSNLL